MSEHRHPRCITPASGTAAPAVDLAVVESLRARVAELEAERIRWCERVVVLETRNAELERQGEWLMCWVVGAYVDGDLDSERSAAFGLHLAKCERCQTEVASLMLHSWTFR